MKTPIKFIPVKILLLTEKRYADIPKGTIIRDYKVSNSNFMNITPKLNKTRQKQFEQMIMPPDFEKLIDESPSKPLSTSYQVIYQKIKNKGI